MRKPRNQKYRIKAYYIENDIQHTFWCKENKMQNMTNEMGASLPLSNGERVLETDSQIDFKIGQRVSFGGQSLIIFNTNPVVDNSDLNSMRGNARYVTTVMIK